jgi:hypothetical protein
MEKTKRSQMLDNQINIFNIDGIDGDHEEEEEIVIINNKKYSVKNFEKFQKRKNFNDN